MGQKYLIDTNILIYNLKSAFPKETTGIMDSIFNVSFYISIVSEIEFCGWQSFTDEQFAEVREYLNLASILPLDHSIKEKVIELKRSIPIKMADAIIAATAIVYDYTLVTRNTKDFKNIAGLKLYNPFDQLNMSHYEKRSDETMQDQQA